MEYSSRSNQGPSGSCGEAKFCSCHKSNITVAETVAATNIAAVVVCRKGECRRMYLLTAYAILTVWLLLFWLSNDWEYEDCEGMLWYKESYVGGSFGIKYCEEDICLFTKKKKKKKRRNK